MSYFIRIFILLLSFIVFFSTASFSEPIIVSARGSYDVKKLELKDSKTAKVIVYLKSQGEEVGGYQISIYRDSDATRLDTKVSNEHGIVEFDNLKPQRYTVILLRSFKMKKETTIAIGDFLIEEED